MGSAVGEVCLAPRERDVIVITGGAGFIGTAVVRTLAERFRVVAFDRETSPHPLVVAECICIDLTSDDSIATALARLRIAYGDRIASVIHLAAYFDLTGEPNTKYGEVTVQGTERLLRAFQEFELEQFVFVSTMLVHAPSEHGKPINEDWPLDPKLPYRESKILTEQLIREHRGNIPVVLVRPAGIYDDLCHSAFLAHQIARIHERRLISHFYSANLDIGQSFLHLDDLVDALSRIVERRNTLPPELPLLLGEKEVLGFGQIQRELGELLHGETWRTLIVPAPIARAGVWTETDIFEEDPFIKPWMIDISGDHYALDTSRARNLLDWEPQHSLRAILPKMVEALKRDPVGWYRSNDLNSAKVAAEGVGMKTVEHENKDPVQEHMMMREHIQGMRKMHFDVLWVHYLNLLLGAWLATSPFIFGSFSQDTFSDAVWRVTQERGLWEPGLRSTLLAWSDVISGLLVMSFSIMSLSPRLALAQWANATVGVWVLFAPLVFWAPTAAAYTNDTMIGALVITFSILVPMMPA